ncbi:ran-specific GTPase-activating protein [Parasteatoda tepidariorum]|nr:ran-specific GTPase-activating protein [Parasteatoda tepidariorum]
MTEEQDDVFRVPSSPDIHFEPIVRLPLVEIKTLEEDEEVLFKMRAKLYRYDSEDDPPQWKERGIGEIKILKHKSDECVRILMRRDKTLKICANHYLQPYMELKPNNTSDKAWVWSTMADFADEEPKPELLAIRFASVENAQKFKEAFDAAKSIATQFSGEQKSDLNKSENDKSDDESDDDDKSSNNATPEKSTKEVADKLSNLTVEDKKDKDETKDDNTEDKSAKDDKSAD